MNLRDWPRLQSILSSEASWHCLLSSWFFIVIGINEGKMSYRDFSPDSMISNFSFSWFQKPDLEIWSTTVQTKTSSKNLIWRLRATWIWFRQIFEETLAKKGLIASWKSPENGTILVFHFNLSNKSISKIDKIVRTYICTYLSQVRNWIESRSTIPWCAGR